MLDDASVLQETLLVVLTLIVSNVHLRVTHSLLQNNIHGSAHQLRCLRIEQGTLGIVFETRREPSLVNELLHFFKVEWRR